MELIRNPKVAVVFDNYPKSVQKQMFQLRSLVLETAAEIEELKKLEETLKWGEPSYLTKHGSTLRMDWKAKTPNQYAMYFKCTSRLVEAFKVIFSDTFQFEGKRAIVFQINQKIPVDKLKQCIAMTLTYHKVKHLPFLGA